LKTTVVFAICAAALIPGMIPSHAAAGIMVSELCDPRNNYLTDRFLEIYNPDAEAVDLTGWSLVAIANGVPAFT
jgi:hypothetical protein